MLPWAPDSPGTSKLDLSHLQKSHLIPKTGVFTFHGYFSYKGATIWKLGYAFCVDEWILVSLNSIALVPTQV